jgi:hypothetical protein
MDEGVKQVEGGTLVARPESDRVRLPRPADGYGVYRLLLDGRLVEGKVRARGDVVYLDYLAADEAGETDMFLILNDPSAPLTGYLRDLFVTLLMGKARVLQRVGDMCQTLVESFEERGPVSAGEPLPAKEDLRAAELSLEEAHRAVSRAAASLGKLEELVGNIRGDVVAPSLALLDLSAFSPQQRERLLPLRDACAQAAPILLDAAEVFAAQDPFAALTIPTYQSAWEQARAATNKSEALLAAMLPALRVDLQAGVLPSSTWPLHDWLIRMLKSLSAGLL